MQTHPRSGAGRTLSAAALLALAASPPLPAAIDGTDDGSEGYTMQSTQVHAPAWGSGNHLSNLRTAQVDNNLNVLLAGKPSDNALLLFIDSKPGGFNSIPNTVITSGGEENTINSLNGFTFETGFAADFAVRVYGNAFGAYVNTYNLATGVRQYAGDSQASNISNTFIADARTVWSDLAAAAADHANGVEISLDLAALGVPAGNQDVRLFAMLINGNSNFASNQMLGSQDLATIFGPSIVGANLQTEPGTQTITVPVTAANPDNDGDGLLNTVETNTGTFLNAGNTGSDPNDADTDDDFLNDGDEVNTHSTNPNLADTDGGGTNDATELSLGTLPQAGNGGDDLASNGDLAVVGFDFFDYPDGGIDGQTGAEVRVFDYDNRTDNDSFLGHTGAVARWSTSFGTRVECARLVTVNGSSASRNLNGAASGGTALSRFANETGANSTALYVAATMTRSSGATYSGIGFLNGGAEVAFTGVPNALNDGARSFGAEITGETDNVTFSGVAPQDGTPYRIVAKLDPVNESVVVWVDPNLAGSEPGFGDAEAFFVFAGNAVATGVRLASGGAGTVLWDDLVVATSWEGLSAASPTDSDNDNLRDSWEEAYSPGDLTVLAEGVSADADTLTNNQEQARGTDPLDPDSDGDTLDDDVETGTGIWVSTSDRGTDPCGADSDDDGLADGVETNNGPNSYVSPANTGTNPNLADTDTDDEGDGLEVSQGTDPTDAGSNSAALGRVIVDGALDSIYGSPLAVQTVQTEFGDNQSELDAAYAVVQDGKLYLLLTGNIQDNFNKLSIVIDSKAGGSGVLDAAGNDNTNVLDGLTFDAGFAPDYHLIVRRGTDGNDKFDLDIANLTAAAFDSYQNILAGAKEGTGATPAGTVNASPIRVAYDDSNTAGVSGGSLAADPVAAAAVTTGLELCIDLADLGNPSGELRIAAWVTSSDHSFMSNQILGGVPAPQGNLGTSSAVNFSALAGDQFFTVTVPAPSDLRITSVRRINGGTQLEVVVEGLVEGSDYVVGESTTLSGFTNLPAQAFTATGSSRTLVLDVSGPRYFIRVADAP